MKYFYFILAVYPQAKTGLPVFENILEFESKEPLDNADSLRRASDEIKNFLGEQGAILHSFQLIRTEQDETDGVKIPDHTSQNNGWIDYKNARPAEMQRVLVKDAHSNVYYAVYYEHDGFDVHKTDLKKSSLYRTSWYKFTHRSYPCWKPIV